MNLARYELRRCLRARTGAMCGRTRACKWEIHSGKCVGCACVRPFFDVQCATAHLHTFAHFLGPENATCLKNYSRTRTSYPVLEHLFLLWNILS